MADEFDVVVAGAGIAGLTAALTSARRGRSTHVLTGGVPGGLLLSIEKIEGVPGHPDGVSGYELCPLTQEQAAASGASFSMAQLDALEPADGSWRLTTSEGEIAARAVVLATGARLRQLGVPGEERFSGRGVSHCASCDAPLLRGQVVGVVGGGDSALQEALTLAESAAEVIVFHRGERLSAQAWWQERALAHPRVSVRYRTVVEEILGDEKVAGVRTRELDSDTVDDVAVAGVFVYVGLEPCSELVGGLLALDSDGRVPTDAWLRTEARGLLAAGAVRAESNGQAAGAIGDGATAAITAHRYLADGGWPEGGGVPVSAFVEGGERG